MDSTWEQKKLEATLREMLAAGAARPTGSPTLSALRPKGVAKGQAPAWRGLFFETLDTILNIRDNTLNFCKIIFVHIFGQLA